MANIRLAAMIESLSGKSGNVVFKKRGKTLYMARRPDFRRRKLSPGQIELHQRFKAAVATARTILADPDARKAYEKEAKETQRSIFNIIMADLMSGDKPEGRET